MIANWDDVEAESTDKGPLGFASYDLGDAAGTNLRLFFTVFPPTGTFEDEDDLLHRRIGLRRGFLRRNLQSDQTYVERARRQTNVLTRFNVGPADDHSSPSPSQ